LKEYSKKADTVLTVCKSGVFHRNLPWYGYHGALSHRAF